MKRKRIPPGLKLRTCLILIKNIPRDVRDGFKAYCARRGISMRQRLEELMRQDVNSEIRTLKDEPLNRKPPF